MIEWKWRGKKKDHITELWKQIVSASDLSNLNTETGLPPSIVFPTNQFLPSVDSNDPILSDASENALDEPKAFTKKEYDIPFDGVTLEALLNHRIESSSSDDETSDSSTSDDEKNEMMFNNQ